MRKVKAAAIQPGYIRIPESYNCFKNAYINDAEAIMEGYIKQQAEVTLRLLQEAGKQRCDIVTTSEDMAGLTDYAMDITSGNIFPELVDYSEKYIEGKLSEISERYSMYIVGCYFKKIDGRIYNVASIFDRKGHIYGEYRKTHMPANEKWQCTEGNTIDVFELDFGKISACICYDMMFPEVAQVQALKGAEVIFHPTLGYGWYDSIGEATLRTRANDNSVYIVTSKNHIFNGAGKSSIIDFWGHVLADAGFYENTIVYRELDLDIKKEQPCWHYSTQTSGICEVDKRKLLERRPELYGIISEITPERLVTPGEEEKRKVLERIRSGECHW